jgi:predicted unusual protein kinase regulating ubiquinone biosynthesis (AarF/ABC1/UbiB family)
MVFNATFHNISVILWRSVLLMEETGENHRPTASHGQTLESSIKHHKTKPNQQVYNLKLNSIIYLNLLFNIPNNLSTAFLVWQWE